MKKAHLILSFDAPIMSFGGVVVDNFGYTDPFPSASMLAGLIGNALGYDRAEGERLQVLQDRLVYAARVDRPGLPLMDFQTAAIAKDDKGWTTRGEPEGRAGGEIRGKHIRYRHYWADRVVRVALRLEPADGPPDLDEISAALVAPARPLFIGRKPCLPSAPILADRVEASSAVGALELLTPFSTGELVELFWPDGEDGVSMPLKAFDHTGRRDWVSGVHGGWERWNRGVLAVGMAP